jgi:hypothetical protein
VSWGLDQVFAERHIGVVTGENINPGNNILNLLSSETYFMTRLFLSACQSGRLFV